jgi:DNA (cytosine-5)-methyltransferase 1
MGFARAGFEVVGVDIAPQPNYPFEFWQADALEFLRDPGHPGIWWDDLYDAIHASPPCQAFTKAQKLRWRSHPDLIAPTRRLLEATGLPYVIENVPGAPLIDPVVLVGNFSDVGAGRNAMGIDWMTRDELSEAIPPAYTELIGHQLAQHLQARAA